MTGTQIHEPTREELVQDSEALIEMFGTPGWKVFQKELEDNMTSIETSWPNVADANAFFQFKGNMYTLRFYNHYELIVRNRLDGLEKEDEAVDELIGFEEDSA